jgi:hypothetical protein
LLLTLFWVIICFKNFIIKGFIMRLVEQGVLMGLGTAAMAYRGLVGLGTLAPVHPILGAVCALLVTQVATQALKQIGCHILAYRGHVSLTAHRVIRVLSASCGAAAVLYRLKTMGVLAGSPVGLSVFALTAVSAALTLLSTYRDPLNFIPSITKVLEMNLKSHGITSGPNFADFVDEKDIEFGFDESILKSAVRSPEMVNFSIFDSKRNGKTLCIKKEVVEQVTLAAEVGEIYVNGNLFEVGGAVREEIIPSLFSFMLTSKVSFECLETVFHTLSDQYGEYLKDNTLIPYKEQFPEGMDVKIGGQQRIEINIDGAGEIFIDRFYSVTFIQGDLKAKGTARTRVRSYNFCRAHLKFKFFLGDAPSFPRAQPQPA